MSLWGGRYLRWSPLPELEGQRVYCEAVHDDWEGFRIWLRHERTRGPVVVARFDSKLLYLNSDEGMRLKNGPENPASAFPIRSGKWWIRRWYRRSGARRRTSTRVWQSSISRSSLPAIASMCSRSRSGVRLGGAAMSDPAARLLKVASTGDLSGVRHALASGAPIDATNPLGSTALMCAAAMGHAGIVELLIAHGAALESRAQMGPDRACASGFPGNT